jgi:uncharacterized protein YqeY
MKLETLQAEMIKAMKNKDKLRKDVISGLVDAVKKASITDIGRIEITEDLIAQVLLKEQKTVQEMIDTCPETRQDLLTEYKSKLAIVNEFAPQLITDPAEIKALIEELVEETDLTLTKADRGKFMKIFKGKVDMKVANQVLGGMLQ